MNNKDNNKKLTVDQRLQALENHQSYQESVNENILIYNIQKLTNRLEVLEQLTTSIAEALNEKITKLEKIG
jgi:uncharacterized coiled-coil protein SlyX